MTARLDISDPKLKEAVASVRSDSTPDMYCIFTYEGKSKIVCKEIGQGSMADMAEALDEGEIAYVLLRGEGPARARARRHRPLVPPSRRSSALFGRAALTAFASFARLL